MKKITERELKYYLISACFLILAFAFTVSLIVTSNRSVTLNKEYICTIETEYGTAELSYYFSEKKLDEMVVDEDGEYSPLSPTKNCKI